MTGEELNEVN